MGGSYAVALGDPVGPAEALFSRDFFQACQRVLDQDGVFVSQSESPFFHLPFMVNVRRRIDGIFHQSEFYLASIATYPGGNWSFLMGTRGGAPLPCRREGFDVPTRYYTPQLHFASFTLPRYLKDSLRG